MILSRARAAFRRVPGLDRRDFARAGGSVDASLSAQCHVCGARLTGAVGLVFRVAGIRRSSRNPNICTRCSTHITEGELSEITVLFADLSSFTELTHELGPERTHEVVDAFLKMATKVLVKRGAFIDKYIGDAVMALFNVPIRDDDHVIMAVQAAEEVRDELRGLSTRFQLNLEASVGIATGFARVGRLGSEDNKDHTAIGDVVNLAARLQGKAGTGGILISEASHARHPHGFAGAAIEVLALKGFPGPVTALRIAGSTQLSGHGDSPSSLAPSTRRTRTSVGTVVFGILGAPCAMTVLLSPISTGVGAASLAGVAGAVKYLDGSAFRLPVVAIATFASCANLYTLHHARAVRRERAIDGRVPVMTALDGRRTRIVLASSCVALGFAAFEVIMHAMH